MTASENREPPWLARRRALFMRPDAARYLRPDYERWLKPEARDAADAFKANFNPDQPRDDLGRWTDANGNVVADGQPDDAGELPVLPVSDDLFAGQSLNQHIIDEHVGKTDTEPAERIRQTQFLGFIATVGMDRNGSFDSMESARDLTRQTINNNADDVERVASGQTKDAFLTWRFGFVTGREAVLDLETSTIRMRNTYMVGVAIVHDPNAISGYRIVSAYPRNYNLRIGR